MSDSDRIDVLEKLLEEEKKKAETSYKITIGVYAVIIILVIISTTTMYSAIHESTKPASLAEIVKAKITEMFDLPNQLIDGFHKDSDKYADDLVGMTKSYIPKFETTMKETVDKEFKTIKNDLEKPLTDEFAKFIKDSGPMLREAYKEAKANNGGKEPDMNKFIVKIYGEFLQDESIKHFPQSEFQNKTNEVTNQLYRLSAKETRLTKLELADRKIITSIVKMSKLNVHDSVIKENVDKAISKLRDQKD